MATKAMTASATDMARSAEEREKQREELDREFKEMSEVMVREEGLVNHSQAALLLDVTPARITELVKQGTLTRYDFLGRTYVSIKELAERRNQDVKAGRPKRNFVDKVVVGVKAALKTDSLQAKHGGFAGPHERAKARQRKK